MLLTLSGDLQHVWRAFNEDPICAASAYMLLAEHANHRRTMTRNASETTGTTPLDKCVVVRCLLATLVAVSMSTLFVMISQSFICRSWTQGKPTASSWIVLARHTTAPLSYQRFILLHELAWTHLGMLLPCWSWKGPGIGLPVTLKTGLGLLLPEAEARCALSSFT